MAPGLSAGSKSTSSRNLGHTGDVEVARLRVERRTEGVTQSQTPDFWSRVRSRPKWITLRDCVGDRIASFYVDPNQFAVQTRHVLSQTIGHGGCTRPDAEVEIAI